MRNSTLFALGEKQCRVSEIDMRQYERIGDYITAATLDNAAAEIDLIDPQVLQFVRELVTFSSFGEPLPFDAVYPLLDAGAIKQIKDALLGVNAPFVEELKRPDLDGKAPTLAQRITNRQTFRKTMAALIRAGHVNVWGYGFGFYLACVEELKEAIPK